MAGPADPSGQAVDRLATQQAALVRALVAGGPVPAGFAPARITATAAALARKRAREVAKAWPVLAHQLGGGFTDRFLAYAAANPRQGEGVLADGLAFARALERAGELSGEARVERLMAQARLAHRVFAGAVVAGNLSSPQLVVVVRAPLLGLRWLGLPLNTRSPRF